MAQNKYIDLLKGHKTVIGITRSGKTVAVAESLNRIKNNPVIFFNTQLEEYFANEWLEGDIYSESVAFKQAIRQNKKVNFLPPTNDKSRDKMIIGLINTLYDMNLKKDLVLVCDEVHLYNKNAQKALIKVATTGLRFKIHLVVISQRLALIDKTLITQSNEVIFFNTNFEGQYFKRYGINADKLKNMLREQYTYVAYDFKELKGPYKVSYNGKK